jgi:hypothetical protein
MLTRTAHGISRRGAQPGPVKITAVDVEQDHLAIKPMVLAATEAQLPQFEIQLAQGKNALQVLFGMDPQPLDVIIGDSSGIPTAPDDGLGHTRTPSAPGSGRSCGRAVGGGAKRPQFGLRATRVNAKRVGAFGVWRRCNTAPSC